MTPALETELRGALDEVVAGLRDHLADAGPRLKERGVALAKVTAAMGVAVIENRIKSDVAKGRIDDVADAVKSETLAEGFEASARFGEILVSLAQRLIRIADARLGGIVGAVTDAPPAQAPQPEAPPAPDIPSLSDLRSQIDRINDLRRPSLPSQPHPEGVQTSDDVTGFTEAMSAAENLFTAVQSPSPSNPAGKARARYAVALEKFDARTRQWIAFGT